MTNKNKTKNNGNNIKRTRIIFWTCLVIILLPFVVLGVILFSSSLDTHHPVLGNRYKNDLDPEITDSQIETIKSNVSNIEGVENVDIEMPTATLRIYADINDDANSDTAYQKADEIYNTLSQTLDPNTYFTKTDSKKMYDLEIHVYTVKERTNAEGENFVYVIKTKTSSMSEPQSQLMSSARDEALAQSLRDDVEQRKAEAAAAENTSTETSGTTDTTEATTQE